MVGSACPEPLVIPAGICLPSSGQVCNVRRRNRCTPGCARMRTCRAFGRAGRAGVSQGSTLTAFPNAMPWRRFAPCVGRCLMSACSREQIVYSLSARISEPGHGQADGAHLSARGGPPHCASTCGAGFVWSVLGSPIREGGRQCVHIVRGWDWNVALTTCEPIGEALPVRHSARPLPPSGGCPAVRLGAALPAEGNAETRYSTPHPLSRQ